MASFLCDLVKPYVEKLINGAIAEAHHVFCFTCIVKEFEEERARYLKGSSRFPKYVGFCGDEDEACTFSEQTLKYCMQTANALCLEGIKGEWRNLMPEIVSVEHGKLNLCNLKTITLQNCPMLVSLFEVLTSQSLALLETLKIANCEKLETIIAGERREDEEIDDGGNNKSYGSVFSKLKVIVINECHRLESILPFLSAQDLPALETIRISECDGLKYVFGQSQHVELVSLSELELSELPNFIGIFEECNRPMSSCVKGSSSTSKVEIQLDPIKCNIFSCCQTTIPLVDGDQPHDYLVASESNSYRLNIWERLRIQSKILCNIKEIVLTHFPKMKSVFILSIDLIMQLESLKIMNCDELKYVIIDTGDHNTGGNNWANVFPKLKKLYVEDCAQLKYIFGPETNDHQNHMEVQLHFPELTYLHLAGLPRLIATIEECEELEHIIEDDLENKDNSNSLSSTTCFPKLETLYVTKCNRLKYVLPFSVCKELPKLKALLIIEANELEEIFKGEDDQKVDIPNLNIVAFDMLPSLCCAQGNQFQAVKNRFVRNCQKLTLTSASTTNTFEDIEVLYGRDFILHRKVRRLFEQLPTNSKELLNQQSMDQQYSLEETDTIVKPSQGIEIEGTSKTNNDQVSKSKPSPNITAQFPSTPSKGDPSQKVEDLSSSLLVKRELEELIFKKHLKYENLSLLTDFLVENPSVRLKDTSLSNRYKGCAYKSLAELLKFLKNHSLLEVSGSSHSEFVELLQDARSFAFDKEWLDGAERRTLFPEIQVSPDDLEKLLDSKKQITKNVEDLKHQLTSSEAVLESIVQQEAVLRAPIGY
ncbi:hypothetical protein TSUD_350610 [Trifolium subterraneum]|uniref:Disease resistance protein At4g27190-like leucine-rich repeats domain-containing protein n=1 Tax=Trifolium subterraneum TaxID=3900 RepID=A0A2Z6PSI6_TRISU|nr:hypothetical protein TSUD_350610 [Trifolium subterraneum]